MLRSNFKINQRTKELKNERTKSLSSLVFQFFSPSVLTLLCALFCFGICHLLFAQDEFVYDSKGKRNPFIPLVTSDGRLIKLDKEEARGELWIDGIIYDKNGRSYALINGMVVEIGGSVGDYKVLKIEENKVIFIKDGQITELELKRED